MIVLLFIYLLIGLVISSLIAGFIDSDYDGAFIILALIWPIFIAGVLLSCLIFLFRFLGETFRELFVINKEDEK